MTSISLWLLTAIMFVAGATLEYAVILLLKRKLESPPPLKEKQLSSRTITLNKVTTVSFINPQHWA